MGLTPAQRKANERARKKGLPEPYSSADIKAQAEAKAEKESATLRLLAEVAAFDATGKRFKSEARTLTQLVRIFYGQPDVGDADNDETSGSAKKKDEGPKRPNPSETRIRIQGCNSDPIEKLKGRRKVVASAIEWELDDVVDFWRWLELRDRARKDLFWLGRLLGKGLYRSVHQITCDQFVQKNFGGPWLTPAGTVDETKPMVGENLVLGDKIYPTGMYFDGYTLDHFHEMINIHHMRDDDGNIVNPEGREREMMLLDSRGFYKSTIDGLDSVQWLLNCPDIRILIITGEYKLANAFLTEIKNYFYMAKGQNPTAFHLLFPEYVLFTTRGETLQSPARLLEQKEDSLWVNSIVANLSGWHCDLKKGDDIVTDENSNTEEAREKIKIKYDGTDDLLDPHGFMDHIGTRYFTDDWYGTRLAAKTPLKYHCRGCWSVKAEYSRVPIYELTAEMVDLTFPQRWSFTRLKDTLEKKGEKYFRNQQLNEPSDAEEENPFRISFTEADLRAHFYQREAAPKAGDIFIVWDWALSNKKTSDYSVGVVARLYRNDAGEWAFVILEIIYDKWKYSELAHQIVALSKRWGPKVTMIEQSNAADMLKDEITRVSRRFGYEPYIYWKQPSREDNAKRNRIKSLEMLLSEHRLHFVLGSWIDETIKQFTQYTGEKKNKGRKDDIPDAASYLTYLLPMEARPKPPGGPGGDPAEERRLREEQDKQWRKARNYERMFGSNLLTNTQAGPVIETPQPEKTQDPRMRIFGSKGPWRL